VRIKDGPPQATLPWKERARNIRGAFACLADLHGKKVAVVDDVMTTGASLNELALTLKQAGASRVENWVVARTLPPR
jgi:predicted amidophosphoribosyltransferase